MKAAPLLIAVVTAALPAQQHEVGKRSIALSNPTSKGSPTLYSTVFYPATSTGIGTPLLPRQTAYPLAVFLPGFIAYGWMYVELGHHLAASGYIAVMSDGPLKNLDLQVEDGVALLAALQKENERQGSFLAGALDTDRAALIGHSSGASNVFRVLARNPGYRLGVPLAPFLGQDGKFLDPYFPKIAVPMVMISGAGDKITPWGSHAYKAFKECAYRHIKLFYLMNESCNHMTVAAWINGRPIDREIFGNSMLVVTGALDHFLQEDPRALDAVLGEKAEGAKYFRSLFLQLEEPVLFKRGSEALGGAVEFEIAWEGGLGAHMWAASRTRIRTPAGWWLLDLATFGVVHSGMIERDKRLTFRLPIPKDPALRGLVVPLQGIAVWQGARFKLTGGVDLVIPR